MDKLPNGWEEKRLLNFCSRITDGSHHSPKSVEKGLPYITVKDVSNNGDIDLMHCKKISNADFEELVKGNCQPNIGDVLLSKDGTVGKTAIVYNNGFVLLSSLAILSPKKNLLSKYLYYFLNSPSFQDTAIKAKTGAAIKRIVLKTIKEFKIPVAPLSEQKRIVSRLDALFERIDKSIALLEENVKQTVHLKASALDRIFNELEAFEIKTFDEIKDTNVIGLVKSAKEQVDSYEYSYFKMNNISNSGRLFLRDIVSVNATEKEVEKYSLEKDDFLFNTRNSKELVGKTCVYDTEKQMLFNNNIMRARFKKDINPYFIDYQFKSSSIKYSLENIKSGTTNVSAIYYKSLKDLKLKVPEKKQQDEIAHYMTSLEQKTDLLVEEQKNKLANLKALKESILDEAFKGEL